MTPVQDGYYTCFLSQISAGLYNPPVIFQDKGVIETQYWLGLPREVMQTCILCHCANYIQPPKGHVGPCQNYSHLFETLPYPPPHLCIHNLCKPD